MQGRRSRSAATQRTTSSSLHNVVTQYRVGRACSRWLCGLVGTRRPRPFPDITLGEREVGEPVAQYILPAQLLRLVASTSSLPPQMVSWPFQLLSWPVRNHLILLVLALVLRGQLVNANGCRHRPFIVDSSDLDAGVTFSGASWATKKGAFFFGGSTMRTSSNGDSVEFPFKGPFRSSVRPHTLSLCPCG